MCSCTTSGWVTSLFRQRDNKTRTKSSVLSCLFCPLSFHVACYRPTFTGKPLDAHSLMNSAVSNVICCLVFGERFEYGDKQYQSVLQTFGEQLLLEGSLWAQVSSNVHVFSQQWILEGRGNDRASILVPRCSKIVSRMRQNRENVCM